MLEKTVVITGGAGFIGSHFAEHFASISKRVIIVDDLSTGRFDNIKDLVALDNVGFTRLDVQNKESLCI